jgi:hydrogenase nickel incorporation protein HypB
MCATCGCSDDAGVRVSHVLDENSPYSLPVGWHTHADGTSHAHGWHTHADGTSHSHDDHSHDHNHDHVHPHEPTPQVHSLEVDVLTKNDQLAAINRAWLKGRGVVAFNVMSSPGSGKTTLLVRTLTDLSDELGMAVIEGDQETLLDAERIRETGVPVVQVNTGAGCHLDAEMLATALERLDPATGSALFIENVGNLVCPALFDLGESARVVITSVTEGDDKPLKYPHMFADADLLIVNKMDLLPYVTFDVDKFLDQARIVQPGIETITLSATTGEGLTAWYDWLRARVADPALTRR